MYIYTVVTAELQAPPGGLIAMADDPCRNYLPPDPTVIEDRDDAYCFWARSLEFEEERIRRAVRKVGHLVEDVKRELGSFGVG